MKQIKFSNWNNKLDLDVFTTIRIYETNKYYYYPVGETWEVLLNSNKVREVELIGYQEMKFKDIQFGLVCMDTGMRFNQAKDLFRRFGIYHETMCIILTFAKKKD